MQRIEKKYLVDENSINKILKEKNVNLIYPSRKINSIYFDTLDLKDFHDSEEGTVPRKKIRFRWYGESNLNKDKMDGAIEIKRTLAENRTKKVIKIDSSLNNIKEICNNFSTQQRYPVCIVSYNRSYFLSSDNIRITIDRNIKFIKLDNFLEIIDINSINQNILEFKYNNAYNQRELLEYNFAENYRVRFSKYCEAIKSFNNTDYIQERNHQNIL